MPDRQQLERNAGDDKFGYFESKRAFLFPDFPKYIDTKEITTTSTAFTVPEWAIYAILSYEGDVAIAVRKDSAAVFPSGTITDGTGSLINPTQFGCGGMTTINIVGKSDTVVAIGYYK
jgi:hypothetical protein